jgi:EAL domain-containing protein (putative c-di-GMP-specific phosphodiesterase class I)
VGAEALARWMHPTRGIVSAQEFVPVAEETGLVLDVDDCIVRSAVEGRAALAQHGVPDTFRIWCNISPRELTRSRPTERLLALLERVGCPPHLIGIEITETAVLPDVKAAGYEIAAARAAGIKVALDDFGTGYSSMTLLRSLPIDKLKIDRTFVDEFTRDPRAAAIVRRVLGLADDLGLDVAAEGVETEAQAELLRELGCSKAQGYLWARALPIEQLTWKLCGSADDAYTVPTTNEARSSSSSEQVAQLGTHIPLA